MNESSLPAVARLQAVREHTIEALCTHFARDNLSAEELEQRLDLVHTAATAAELKELLADLPALPPPVATTVSDVARASSDEVHDRQVVMAIMGGAERRGAWTPPRQLSVVAVMGGVELDFREARFGAEGTEIYLFALMGGAEIIVPPGVRVETQLVPIMGGVEHRGGDGTLPPPGAPTLRISGVALMGGVEISERRPGESAREAKQRLRLERRERRQLETGKLRVDTAAAALLVHERLCAVYECPIAFFHELDPLSELISSLLSHRTRNRDSGRAFRQLRAAFPAWEDVRDAPVAEVQAAIAPCTWPEQKAPRIQEVLREITERHEGDLSLEFLGELPVPEAREWLESLPGVGPKTSAATLLFSRLRRPALPVDSHHHRVATRVGLLPPKTPVGRSHALLEALLPPDWSAQQVYDHHEVFMLHGQRCCFPQRPACERCAVLDLCPTGQARMAIPSASPATEAM